MIEQLTKQLTRDEGKRLKPYVDTVGKTTIGVGRNLSDVGISEEECALLLTHDIQRAGESLRKAFPWVANLDEARLGVLINMTFNMGIDRLSQFQTTLHLIEAGKYDDAAMAMLDSKWSKQVGARAMRLSVQLRTGSWQ